MLASCGIAAPILFSALVIVLGLVEPGYDHRTEMMSLLGGVGGARGAVFNLGTALTGMLLIGFAIGLHRGIAGGEGSRVGPILIVLAGGGMVGSAVFHCNQGCTNVLESPTLTGTLHTVAAFVTGSCIAISPLVIFARLRRDRWWKNCSWFTLAMGIMANIPGLILWTTFLTTRMPEWEGVIQRLRVAYPLLWVEVMAVHLLRLAAQGASANRRGELPRERP
jgi:hypothetical membrane protein